MFLFIPTGAPGAANYASYIYWSLRGTLDSIATLLRASQITDAYTLVRKYLDDVLIEIYFDVVRKEKFDWSDRLMFQRFEESFSMIDAENLEEHFVELHWAVNDMDNFLYETDV